VRIFAASQILAMPAGQKHEVDDPQQDPAAGIRCSFFFRKREVS
jgi:hypothetical protein